MIEPLPLADYSIARHVVFTLPARRRPWVVHCLHGRLWVTHGASVRDFILCRGDRLRVPAGAAVVVEALRSARFDCEPVAVAPAAFDLGRLMQRLIAGYA